MKIHLSLEDSLEAANYLFYRYYSNDTHVGLKLLEFVKHVKVYLFVHCWLLFEFHKVL